MKAVIDTNIFIYSLVEDSEYHRKSKDLLFSFETWIVPSIVLYELLWFFRDNGLKFDEIEPLILQILDSKKCKVIGDNGIFVRRALELCRSLSPGRFNDMIILSVAEKHNVLATFDKKLRNKARKMGIKTIESIKT